MKFGLITFRSVTFAQRGQSVFGKAGIESVLRRTPKGLDQRGCGYCLQLRGRDLTVAVRLLDKETVDYGRVFVTRGGENWEEWPV